MSEAIHVLVITSTGDVARRISRTLRAHTPTVVLHGPLASAGEAQRYLMQLDSDVRLNYAIVDHAVDDGYGIDLWCVQPLFGVRPVVLIKPGDPVAPYQKQSVYTLPIDEIEAKLPTVMLPPRKGSPVLSMECSLARWIQLDLEGKRPVYRRVFVQHLESWQDDSVLPVGMPVSAIAHYYEDQGVVWAVACSGNLNPTPHTIDQLEAELRPEVWCRINDQQIISTVAISPDEELDFAGLTFLVTSPLRNVVDPARADAVHTWLKESENYFMDPDDDQELDWEV